ncbi:MAG TPA: ABC transporter ATP-binding protein [Acidimicrobiales bacterium]|nr:ABC transporter ATP-binding protein [Acidimicrobiales bacterium]
MRRLRQSAEWRFFGVMFEASAGLTVAWWALVVLRGALPAAFAVSMGVLVGSVQDGDPLGGPLAAMGVTFVVMQAIGPLHEALSTNLGAQVTAWLNDRLLQACSGPEGLAHLEQPSLADELGSAREFEFGMAGPNITVSMPNIGSGFASFAGGLASALLLLRYRWWAPILVGGSWLATHKLLAAGAIWRSRHDPDVAEAERRAMYAYRLSVDAPSAKEMRLFGLADWVVEGFITLRRDLLERSWRARRFGWIKTQQGLALVAVANVVFFWSLARDASAGRLSLGVLVVLAQAAIGASSLAFGEFDWWLRTAAQPVPMVLDLVEKMADVGTLASGGRPATGMPASEIRLQGVRFAYPMSEHVVFDGLNLTIPAGRSLAIVGQNGAGKTTLAKLLCRMYDPVEGAVLVDGVDARELDVASWRSRVAAVFQDFVRYELPLRDNVAPAGGDEADITAALEAASAGHLAQLDTILSRGYADGTDLSGGQWQRVALARAVHAVRAGAGVVILDEPTAQLDVRGEAEIFEKLLDATSGCTTVLISHRFSTVRRADLICVLEEGRVIELGSHDELLGRGGRYATMFQLQAARFEAGAEDADVIELEAVSE